MKTIQKKTFSYICSQNLPWYWLLFQKVLAPASEHDADCFCLNVLGHLNNSSTFPLKPCSPLFINLDFFEQWAINAESVKVYLYWHYCTIQLWIYHRGQRLFHSYLQVRDTSKYKHKGDEQVPLTRMFQDYKFLLLLTIFSVGERWMQCKPKRFDTKLHKASAKTFVGSNVWKCLVNAMLKTCAIVFWKYEITLARMFHDDIILSVS